MKKKRIVSTIYLFLVLSLLFSKGANEKAYDSFWSMIEEYYPLYYVAQESGLDLEGIKEAGNREFDRESDDERMLFIFRSICNKFMTLDYINASLYSPFPSEKTLQTESTKEKEKTPRYQYIPSLKTMILTIPSFNKLDLSEDFICQAFSDNYDVENIIFDVTGNKRGNYDNDDITAVISPFGGSWSYSYRAYYRNKNTPEKLFDKDEIKETEIQIYRETYRLPFYVDVTRNYNIGESTLSEGIKNARRWILVDETTSYTADFFASFASSTGWATVVGTNTKGNGTGLPFLSAVLDGKKYVLVFNSCVVENKNGDLKSIYGTIPDIKADEGRSALSVCLNMIEEQLKGEEI